MLADIQKVMAQSVFQKEYPPEYADAFPNYSEEEIQARLAIYRNNYFFSLIDVLKDTFPTLLKLVGDDFFTALCKEFIIQNPPSSPVLTQFGDTLAQFIYNFQPLKNYPFMHDVCLVDWHRHSAWYSDGSAGLTAESFAAIEIAALSEATISFHPSARFVQSEFAIFSIWLENQNETPEEVDASTPESVLILRPETDVDMYKLDKGIFTFLQKLQLGFSVLESIQLAMEADDAFNPTGAIDFLITSGISAQVHTKPET